MSPFLFHTYWHKTQDSCIRGKEPHSLEHSGLHARASSSCHPLSQAPGVWWRETQMNAGYIIELCHNWGILNLGTSLFLTCIANKSAFSSQPSLQMQPWEMAQVSTEVLVFHSSVPSKNPQDTQGPWQITSPNSILVYILFTFCLPFHQSTEVSLESSWSLLKQSMSLCSGLPHIRHQELDVVILSLMWWH